MKRFSSISKRNNIEMITIGKFDSLHLGHQTILNRLDSRSIILFIKMPQSNNGDIVPYNKREAYVKHKMYYIDFKSIKNISGEHFIKYVMKKLPHLKTILVGEDFRFGKNRKCSSADLISMSKLNVIIFDEMFKDGIPIHSSYIRNFILNGDIVSANKLLGRFYSIEGNVIKGQGIGNTELYPTINILVSGYVIPQNGVYVTRTKIYHCTFNSISFVGDRLSTDMNFSIESHIIDRNVYATPHKIEIFFIRKLRNNVKFHSLPDLKKQIEDDIQSAKVILNNIEEG